MGAMKRFADDLAELIFYRKLKDTQILSLYPDADPAWLLQQVRAMRLHPEMSAYGQVGAKREKAE